jgi:hypothetical protein
MNKSFREWLLARHQSATPQLDALRRSVLPAAAPTRGAFLRELFAPHRIAWRALAAVWIALLVFHLTLGRPGRASRLPAPPPAAFAAWLAAANSHEAPVQTDFSP